MCCSKKLIGLLFFVVIIAEAYFIWWMKTDAPVGLIAWVETEDASPYYGPDAPDPPYSLSPEDRQLLVDMVAESHALSSVTGDFETIAALRNLARQSCPSITRSIPTNDPPDVLESFRRGEGGACGAIASVYCAALMAHGYRARVLELIRDRNDVERWKSGPLDTHVEVEVFSPEHRKWFVSDPTFNCWFHLPGSDIPLSARELQLIAVNPEVDFSTTGWISLEAAGAVVAEYDGYDTQPKVNTYAVDPILMFQNVFLLYYDIYGERPEDPVQKYVQIITARLTGSEKVVWLLPPGQNRSRICYYNMAANWLPVAALVLLLMLLVPTGRPATVVEEEEETEEEE